MRDIKSAGCVYAAYLRPYACCRSSAELTVLTCGLQLQTLTLYCEQLNPMKLKLVANPGGLLGGGLCHQG